MFYLPVNPTKRLLLRRADINSYASPLPFSLSLPGQNITNQKFCVQHLTSLVLALAGAWVEAATFAHTLPKSFAFLWSHVLPALGHAIRHAIGHAAADIGARAAVESKSAEQDPAQQQHPERLPEGDFAPGEERRQQPIPEVQHYLAADCDKHRQPQDRQRSYPNQSLQSRSHVQFLTLS